VKRLTGRSDRTADTVAIQMDNTIIDALDRLPRRIRSVVLLRFVANLDYSQVAKQLDIDRASVQALELRGWKALQSDQSLASLNFDQPTFFRHRSALRERYEELIGPALREKEDRDIRLYDFMDFVRSRRNVPCEFCGAIFGQVAQGRNRHYCSNKCRQAGYRARQRAMRSGETRETDVRDQLWPPGTARAAKLEPGPTRTPTRRD
jgi:hypothetical protein